MNLVMSVVAHLAIVVSAAIFIASYLVAVVALFRWIFGS